MSRTCEARKLPAAINEAATLHHAPPASRYGQQLMQKHAAT